MRETENDAGDRWEGDCDTGNLRRNREIRKIRQEEIKNRTSQ